MPAPGEQHTLASGGRVITNPFEEVKPRISEYTAQEIATLSSKLEKQLGPEYISARPGAGGQKVHYVAAEKCIQLANEVFGFNGWSSQIKEVQVDFVDEDPRSQKVSLGLSVIVRVTLRDGTFHEDIGYGHMENAKGKAAAFEKAKKEGTTDALKRALRNFGNVLGNCIYDKEYLSKVTKVKAPATKWDVDNLHRHQSFVPTAKKEEPSIRATEDKPGNTAIATLASEDTFDDEFGDFDDADFSVADPDSHPDEVVLPDPSINGSNRSQERGPVGSGKHSNQNRAPMNGPQQMPAPPNRQQNGAPVANNTASLPPQPQTPNAGFARSVSNSAQNLRPPPQQGLPPQAQAQAQPQPVVRRLNQPSRNINSAPQSPIRPKLTPDDTEKALPPQGAGFFSARGIKETIGLEGNAKPNETLPNAAPAPLPTYITPFNPHAESPSIRKTPGVDHKSSKPLARDGKHVPSTQTAAAGAPTIAAASGPVTRGNIGNPSLDGMRRIGAPNSPSPMANRNSYKPPSKRPVDSRAPLVDLPANGTVGLADQGGDMKRQRLNG